MIFEEENQRIIAMLNEAIFYFEEYYNDKFNSKTTTFQTFCVNICESNFYIK